MILFIDDEKRYMENYVDELQRAGFTVDFRTDVDSGLAFLNQNKDRIRLLVLDLMMPPGNSFKNENTEMGLRTGVRFYENVRMESPDLMVVVLTNVSDQRIMERFENEQHCHFLRKEDYLPFEFAEEVMRILPSLSQPE